MDIEHLNSYSYRRFRWEGAPLSRLSTAFVQNSIKIFLQTQKVDVGQKLRAAFTSVLVRESAVKQEDEVQLSARSY